MNILFLSYWGITDGLTASTVIPHLELLNNFKEVEMIVYCSIERNEIVSTPVLLPGKVKHIPLRSGNKFADKFNDFTVFPRSLTSIVQKERIHLLICRGTPAGALGFLVYRKLKIPYCVESFEPHAEYMAESGVWRRWGLRYALLRYWEKKQQETAMLLMPVAHGMVPVLAKAGVEKNRIAVMPCSVNAKEFAYDEDRRKEVRANLSIRSDSTVGIYVGKFGGLYYDRESFDIFRVARSVFDKFTLIILSPDDKDRIADNLLAQGFEREEFRVLKADHKEVPFYLSASDMAFALYKKSPSKKFLSPIKVGEYWANGLPVLITEGIGDDAEIINNTKSGATFTLGPGVAEKSLRSIKALLQSDAKLRQRIQQLALNYRNITSNEAVYKKLIQESFT